MDKENKSPGKTRRPRRTNLALDRDIMNAAKTVIEANGFANTTLTAIMQEAGIEPNVFYKRFDNLDKLFDHFVQHYDYWFSNIVDINTAPNDHKTIYSSLLVQLARQLYRNKSMQKILIWELSEDNATTRRTARLRESNSKDMLEILNEHFENSEIDMAVVTALMIGGIYYLTLHKDRSTFCGIDFSTRAGKAKLLETIEKASDCIFKFNEQAALKTKSIARHMKEEGLDYEMIARCTGLKTEDVAEL